MNIDEMNQINLQYKNKQIKERITKMKMKMKNAKFYVILMMCLHSWAYKWEKMFTKKLNECFEELQRKII